MTARRGATNGLLTPALSSGGGEGEDSAAFAGFMPRPSGAWILPTNGRAREDGLLSPALSSGGGEGEARLRSLASCRVHPALGFCQPTVGREKTASSPSPSPPGEEREKTRPG